MKRVKIDYEPGDIVTLVDSKFIVLDVERAAGYYPDTLFILALESVGASEFGSSNNYAESDLKKAVDKWLEDMGKRGLDNAKLLHREIDLTTLDGSGRYGKLSVKAAPLTLDEARKYADIIPNAERWCWLATGWSGPSKSDVGGALYVRSTGDWHYSRCSNSNGIRPALKIPSDLLHYSADKSDLSKVSTDTLERGVKMQVMRLVDANAYKRILEGRLSEVHSGGDEQENAEGLSISSCICQLDDAPTIDAEPVVRCNDCEHFKNYGKTSLLSDGKNIKAGWCYRRIRYDEEYRMPPDGFCSYGKRRNGGNGNAKN